MAKRKRYKDELHGIVAAANSRSMAWALIRNECHKDGKKVPSIDQVKEIGVTTWKNK